MTTKTTTKKQLYPKYLRKKKILAKSTYLQVSNGHKKYSERLITEIMKVN